MDALYLYFITLLYGLGSGEEMPYLGACHQPKNCIWSEMSRSGTSVAGAHNHRYCTWGVEQRGR